MSIDENSIGIYFTSPQDIREKSKSISHQEDVDEYDTDDSPLSSSPCSMTEEYVLPNSRPGYIPEEVQVEMEKPRPKRCAIQDEYDDDLYCLARPVEEDASTIKTEQKKEEENNYNPSFGLEKRRYITKKVLIICIFLSVAFVVVGAVAYFSTNTSGKIIEFYSLRL